MSVSTVFWKSVLLSQNHLLPGKEATWLLHLLNLNKSNIAIADFMHRSVLRLGIEFWEKTAWFFFYWEYKYAAMQFTIWERTVASKAQDWESEVLFVFSVLLLIYSVPLPKHFTFFASVSLLTEASEAWYLRKQNKRCNRGSTIWRICLAIVCITICNTVCDQEKQENFKKSILAKVTAF